MLISENLAREFWGSPQAAVGKRIRETPQAPWREVIGVVGEEHDEGLEKKAPTVVYWPPMVKDIFGTPLQTRRSLLYAIRSTRTGTPDFLNEVRRAVWSMQPDLPVAQVRTLDEIYRRSMARTTFTLLILSIAGVMALVLGVVGIYGVLSYAVSQRTREIGIRMALGAQQGTVSGMFVRQGLMLTGVGVAIGLIAAAAVTRFLSTLLFGVDALDPLTYVAVSVGLLLAATLASYVPARRATAVDPMNALRAE